jgi:hypothetical protein
MAGSPQLPPQVGPETVMPFTKGRGAGGEREG